jgi:IS30 family transposase
VALLAADPELAAVVSRRLKAKDSPMTIAHELAAGVHGVTGSVSHECIHQAIYASHHAHYVPPQHQLVNRPRPLHSSHHRDDQLNSPSTAR